MNQSQKQHKPIDAEQVLLRPREAARRLAICERSLWTLRQTGKIRAIQIGKSVRLSIKELDRFVSGSIEG